MDELAVGFNFLEDGDRADQAPVFPGAVYLDTGGGRAGSKCALRVARLMTRGPNDVADTAVRAGRQVAAGADVVQIANEPNNSVEEWRPFNTNDETLVVEHAEWFEQVCNAAPGVPILWTPPSPGIPGYEIWTNHRRSREAMTRAAGISWHVYGDLALMRETLDVVLPAADELGLDVYVTECNFGAGRTVDLGTWASVDLPAFLDHARRFPRVRLVALFAHFWRTPDSPVATPVNFGGTAVEDAMRGWLAAPRPPRDSEGTDSTRPLADDRPLPLLDLDFEAAIWRKWFEGAQAAFRTGDPRDSQDANDVLAILTRSKHRHGVA